MDGWSSRWDGSSVQNDVCVRRRSVLPGPLVAGPFAISDAVMLGVSAKRLRGLDLRAPFSGVRVAAGTADTLQTRCAAYAQRMRACEVFSHRTAALLHGLPVRDHADGRLDVGAFAPNGIPRSAGVIGHRLRATGVAIERRGGLPLVSPVDAWCQLAPHVSVRELVVIGDALVRRQRPPATIGTLRSAVARCAGRRGKRALDAALDQIRPRTDSPAESELRLDLVAFGLPEPEVNVDILDDSGRRIAIGDLAYPHYRVLVEYDGEHHRTDSGHYARDVDRLDDLARNGWRVVRFNRSHRGIRRTERLARVREALIGAGWDPSSPR